MTNRLEQLCIERGLKMNDKRRAILRVIDEARDHPSVQQLYDRTARLVPDISMATVYRTINALAEVGLLTRLAFSDGKTRYEEARGDRHEHLLDIRSGAITEFESADIEPLIRRLVDGLGYRLVEYRLEVFGEPKSPDDAGGRDAAIRARDRAKPLRRARAGARIASRLHFGRHPHRSPSVP